MIHTEEGEGELQTDRDRDRESAKPLKERTDRRYTLRQKLPAIRFLRSFKHRSRPLRGKLAAWWWQQRYNTNRPHETVASIPQFMISPWFPVQH